MVKSPLKSDRKWAAGAAVFGFAMLALYLTVIAAEGGNSFWAVLPWALLMATAAVIAFASLHVRDPQIARSLLIGAATVYGVIGVVSIFSLGFLFLLGAAAAATGAATISPSDSG